MPRTCGKSGKVVPWESSQEIGLTTRPLYTSRFMGMHFRERGNPAHSSFIVRSQFLNGKLPFASILMSSFVPVSLSIYHIWPKSFQWSWKFPNYDPDLRPIVFWWTEVHRQPTYYHSQKWSSKSNINPVKALKTGFNPSTYRWNNLSLEKHFYPANF